MTARSMSTITIFALLSACTAKSGDADLDRCEAAARKLSKVYGGDENRQSENYRSTLAACTSRPGETLTDAGSDYLDCVSDAAHGAAILSCEYKFQKQAKEEAISDTVAATTPVWKEICSGVSVDTDSDPRMKEANELEAKARALGATDQEIEDAVKKAAKDAGCSDGIVNGIGG